MPPIGERAIAFTGIVPRRFQAIGDTTEHDGFGYHGLSRAWSRAFTQFVQEVIRLPNSAANSVTVAASGGVNPYACPPRRVAVLKHAADRGQPRQAAGVIAALKTTDPPSSAPGGPFVADEVRTIVVLWVCWPACTFRAVPHAASGERCAAPHVASGERRAAPHAAPRDRRAALHVAPHDQRAAQRAVVHPVSYRTVLERLVQEW